MPVSLKHQFTSAIPDSTDPSLIQPSNWNAEHTLTLASDRLLGRASAGTGAVEEITLTAAGRALLDDASASAQRTTLGVGTSDSPTFAGIGVGAGTSALPSIANSADPDTGVFFPATGIVGISTDGVERFRTQAGVTAILATTGNVGLELGTGRTGSAVSFVDLVGDTTYSDYGARFVRQGGGANTGSGLQHRGTGALFLLAEDAGFITLNTNNLERMRISSDGKVGIGTSAPNSALEVVTSGTADLYARSTSSTGLSQIGSIRNDFVSLPSFAGVLLRQYGASSTGTTYGISNANLGALAFQNVDNAVIGTNGATPLIFATLSTERLRVLSDGNIAIGQSTSPSSKLTLSNDRAVTTYQAVFRSTNGGTFENDFIVGYDGVQYLGNFQANPLVFSTSNLERMRIGSDGNIGIGVTTAGDRNVWIRRNITGGAVSVGILYEGTVQSDVTAGAYNFYSAVNTVNATFTTTVNHFLALQGTFGASSTVTSQIGFQAHSSLIGATSNYGFFANDTAAVTAGKTSVGFYSSVNTATGGGTTWAFYGAGTAASYFAGQVQLGAGVVGTPSLAAFGDTNTGMWFPAADTIAWSTGGSERMRVDSNGNVVVNTAAIATNAANGFLYVPSCAGTPTGTPTVFTGRVPIVVDATNNKLYFYSGGQWRDAGP